MLEEERIGSIVYAPLQHGILSDRYVNGIAADSRAAGPSPFLKPQDISEERLEMVKRLMELASVRGQKLAQMALAWVLRIGRVTSALIGASKISHIEDAVGVVSGLDFSDEVLAVIDSILT